MPDPIGSLEDGAEARVQGRVRPAGDTLRSPQLGRECVYWDVRKGLRHEPEEREASPFWIEDDSGRILVKPGRLDVDVRARRTREVLQTVSADHEALTERLRKLKHKVRHATGDEAAQARAEQRHLAKVATYLLAVRAHAKGKLHMGGMTLREQERWIETNRPGAVDDAGAATVAITVDRYEVVLAEGDSVVAEGVAAIEPVPPGIGAAGGYRDRPTCLVLGPGSSGVVIVRGVGEVRSRAAPSVPASRRPGGALSAPSDPAASDRDPVFERRVLAVVGSVLLAALVYYFLR